MNDEIYFFDVDGIFSWLLMGFYWDGSQWDVMNEMRLNGMIFGEATGE